MKKEYVFSNGVRGKFYDEKAKFNIPKEIMNTLGGRLSSNYGWELTFFRKIRNFSDGLSIFDLGINWDRYEADHSPRFHLHFMLLNYTIVEFLIYYLHHRD